MSGLLGFNSLLFLPLSWKVGAQLSEQMCLVRQGGGWHTAIYWIPPGTWNSSSAPPGSPAYIPGQSPLLSIRASLLPRAQGGNVANIGSSSSLCPEQPSRCTLSTTPPPPPPETSERSGRLEVGQRGCCYPEHVRRLCKLCSRPPACWESAFTSRQGVRFKTPPSFYLARERSVPWLRVLLFGWGSWTRG